MNKETSRNEEQVLVLGINHSTTPLKIRERLSISRAQMHLALSSLGNYLPWGIILSTCNRTEVYTLDSSAQPAEQSLRDFLKNWGGISESELAPHIYGYRQDEAARHLSAVASGLDSMIMGEFEILGQVQRALEDAESEGMVNLPLRTLFQHAIRTGRRVREETQIGKNALSVSSVAVDLAANTIGDVHHAKVLLIGAGEAGKLVVQALAKKGGIKATVVSRRLQRAQELASLLGGKATHLSEMKSELANADIVITCTGSPHLVVRHSLVEEAMKSRRKRPLVIIDIAVPRDVEPEVAEIEGVFLYDIDDFNQVSEFNRKEREKEIAKTMQIIEEEMEHFMAWWQAWEVKPTISALMQMAEDVRQRQLGMTLKKLPPLSPEEQDSLEAMTRAIVNQILHNPVQCLKKNGHRNEDFVWLVRELFALEERGSE